MSEDQDIIDARERLRLQVEERKRLEREGKVLPIKTLEERRVERSTSDGVSVADVMKDAVEGFRKMKEKSDKLKVWLDEKLEKRKKEFCIDHENEELLVNYEETFAHTWRNNKLTVVCDPCPTCAAEKKKAREDLKWQKMGVPEKVLHATFENFEIVSPAHAKALQKAKLHVKQGFGFFIARGDFGTGKSHLVSAMLKEAGGGIMVTEYDLIGELRQGYADNAGPDEMVKKYREANYLVLDELSLEVSGKDIAGLLYRILGDRYDKERPVAITSNESLKVILDILGGRLVDRLKENYTVATLEGKSYRGRAR